MVCISGEPGIGKTSLVRKFVETLGGGTTVLFNLDFTLGGEVAF